ncbi:DUF1684 domain-containing protein [Gramella sp. GC03-9]|uniref:DUF1684 domain-containing protein n=1 Tax=Christiangramia oceanisediminis TaxID=2920386 RepID=A0A9X2I870_9FLAO|nr:DUF1684 domain-containing protein [Gramella oceanisediminis]MCP9198997.1 DUF1684 domain-containing protein [Gramella oceanisediminis]
MKNNILLIVSLLFLSSCQQERQLIITKEYLEKHQEFQKAHREEQDYYLSISDVFELDPLGINSFGSSAENVFQLRDSLAPSHIGQLQFEKDSLVFVASPGLEVKLKNDSVIDRFRLASLNDRGHSEVLSYQNYSWYINSHEKVKLLRILDSLNPEIEKFPGFQTYDLDPQFIFKARINRYETPKIVNVRMVGNQSMNAEFIGELIFEHKGQIYTLDFMEGNFIMFGDETSKTETYGAGRYLEFETDENGYAILDFNKAYNPPCSYSGFTTCAYPSEENWLDFAVLAGEKEVLLSK